jgi:hypothetical protein
MSYNTLTLGNIGDELRGATAPTILGAIFAARFELQLDVFPAQRRGKLPHLVLMVHITGLATQDILQFHVVLRIIEQVKSGTRHQNKWQK